MDRAQASDLRLTRVRLGLSQERFARVLGASARSVRRWEATDTAPADPVIAGRLARAIEIATLAMEVCGDDLESFLAMPRRSLGLRSPRDAMMEGNLERVRQLLVDGLEGHWA